MALFEEMLDRERCMAYLKYRESRGETDGRLQGMREYLLRGAYTEDVRRLKTQHAENEDHGIWSHHFMANR